jgi:hypothetical protein
MLRDHTFVGFSTLSSNGRPHQWKLYDMDLIERDLLNHFNTRYGERLGRPTFGCRIWSYLMEQNNHNLVENIVSEIIRICSADQRIIAPSPDHVKIVLYDHGVIASVSLVSDIVNGARDFKVNFDSRQGLATRG